MQIEDDEILQGFIEESLEHLSDIEHDLLAIEEAGADIDEELVNKVFRAAHSIKGGAGFMGLTTIQELSHAMENVLGMIRSKKLIPTSENINVLLLGADQLQRMVADVQSSNDVDISEHLIPLNAIAAGTPIPVAATELPARTIASKVKQEPAATESVVQYEPDAEPEHLTVHEEMDAEPQLDEEEDFDGEVETQVLAPVMKKIRHRYLRRHKTTTESRGNHQGPRQPPRSAYDPCRRTCSQQESTSPDHRLR